MINDETLNAIQLRWQNWRNEQYSDLQQEERFVANNRRANEAKQGTRYAEHDNDLLSREAESLSHQRRSYGALVKLDTEIKTAYRLGDVAAYRIALTKAEKLMST